MACETLQFFRSIGEVILKIHLIKVKVYENQQKSVSGYTDFFTLMISFVFSSCIIDDFHNVCYQIIDQMSTCLLTFEIGSKYSINDKLSCYIIACFGDQGLNHLAKLDLV